MPEERFDPNAPSAAPASSREEAEAAEVGKIMGEIGALRKRVEALGRDRSLSLAITKFDEARHWLLAFVRKDHGW